MADEVDSKSIDGNIVRVQVPRPALHPWQGKELQNLFMDSGAFSLSWRRKILTFLSKFKKMVDESAKSV